MFEHASQKHYETVKTDCFDWFVLYKKQLGSRVMFMIFCYHGKQTKMPPGPVNIVHAVVAMDNTINQCS